MAGTHQIKESEFQKRVRKDLEASGAFVETSAMIRPGDPDLRVEYNGKTFYIELKRDDKSVVGFWQLWKLKHKRLNGFDAVLITNWDEYINFKREIIK